MKSLIFKKYHFMSNGSTGQTGLAVWLLNQALVGHQSRSRSAFVRLVKSALDDIDVGITEIMDRNSEKDLNGKILYIGADGKDTISPESGRRKFMDQVAVNKEIEDFVKEDFIIDVTPSTIGTLLQTKNILTASKESFAGQMATMYDEWCQVFEDGLSEAVGN